MLPPSACQLLAARGHDAITPSERGAHNLPDSVVVEVADAEGRVVVTENARDFIDVTSCPVVFVRKAWWPAVSLAQQLAAALDRWALDHPEPGPWAHWLTEAHR